MYSSNDIDLSINLKSNCLWGSRIIRQHPQKTAQQYFAHTPDIYQAGRDYFVLGPFPNRLAISNRVQKWNAENGSDVRTVKNKSASRVRVLRNLTTTNETCIDDSSAFPYTLPVCRHDFYYSCKNDKDSLLFIRVVVVLSKTARFNVDGCWLRSDTENDWL